ncbi:MAG TPA: hypothetical protein VKZ83_07330 [Phototrophicaceae bacterium]|nr:hypothetical protein [Phototrophicaceae bacterium]
MTGALTWLDRPPPGPLTAAEDGVDSLAGLRHDGLVGPTPLGEHAAVDLLGSPEGRASLLREVLLPGSALARTTAVWVHTGRLYTRRAELVVPPDERVEGPAVVHRQYLGPGDVVPIGGVPTTSPLRTAVDLLCFVDETRAVAGTRALIVTGLDVGAVRDELLRPGRHRPARRALGLLTQVETPPGRRSSS